MPEERRPRGVTPRPRSGAVAESTRLRRHRNGREELPRVRGQAGQAKGVTPRPRSGAAAGRRYPTTEARGSGWEDQPHVQGAMAAWAQKGLEELSHVEGQEGWW